MKTLRILAPICAAWFLLGCDDGNSFRNDGPGLSLTQASIVENAQTQDEYFFELCLMAGGTAFSSAEPLSATGYGKLSTDPVVSPVSTRQCVPSVDLTEMTLVAMNDIDLRCDLYLNWIDETRAERLSVNRNAAALGSFLAGALIIADTGADAIAAVALALGFATSIYDSYQNSILLGLESSTVKQIVYDRRTAFRQSFAEEFRNKRITTRSRSVYVLRNYLRICTPATIVMDVNVFARGDGANPESIAQSTFDAKPPSPSDPVAAPDRPNPTNSFADVSDVANFDAADLRALQAEMCIRADGSSGPETRVNIRMFEYGEKGFVGDGRVSNGSNGSVDEIGKIYRGTCPPGARNVYEKRIGETGSLPLAPTIVNRMIDAKLVDERDDVDQITLGSDTFRELVARSREQLLSSSPTFAAQEDSILGNDKNAYGERLFNQMTPALWAAIQDEFDKVDGGQ